MLDPTRAMVTSVLHEVCKDRGRSRCCLAADDPALRSPTSFDDLRATAQALKGVAMLLTSNQAQRMETAVGTVFARLPTFLQTEPIRAELAECVSRSAGNYEDAALDGAIAVLDRFSSRLRRAAGIVQQRARRA
jgi:hypothetical protein